MNSHKQELNASNAGNVTQLGAKNKWYQVRVVRVGLPSGGVRFPTGHVRYALQENVGGRPEKCATRTRSQAFLFHGGRTVGDTLHDVHDNVSEIRRRHTPRFP